MPIVRPAIWISLTHCSFVVRLNLLICRTALSSFFSSLTSRSLLFVKILWLKKFNILKKRQAKEFEEKKYQRHVRSCNSLTVRTPLFAPRWENPTESCLKFFDPKKMNWNLKTDRSPGWIVDTGNKLIEFNHLGQVIWIRCRIFVSPTIIPIALIPLRRMIREWTMWACRWLRTLKQIINDSTTESILLDLVLYKLTIKMVVRVLGRSRISTSDWTEH